MRAMQFRTEVNLRRLLHSWDGRESAKLHFTEIKGALHWDNRKTSDVLSKAIEEGYLEKLQEKGATVYRNRIADYEGYFDSFEFLAKVDETCRKNGNMQSVELGPYSVTPFHVLAYGIPKLEDLTPLEKELLYSILVRHTGAFYDYVNFCEAVQKRQDLERSLALPESAKSNLFAHEENEKNVLISITAAHAVYGDVLWEHIFQKLTNDIRFALEKGSLDFTGPIELLHSSRPLVNLALKLAKRIYKGELSNYDDPDPESSKKLETLKVLENLSSEGPSDVAVVLTPSPRTMGKYAIKAGRIVNDAYSTWSETSGITDTMLKEKGSDFWHDLLDFGEGRTRTRREMLRDTIVDDLSSMRSGETPPLDQLDKRIMLDDKNLRIVFTKQEIQGIIELVDSLIARAKKFYTMLDNRIPVNQIRRDKEWFTKEEIRSYRLADRVDTALDWRAHFKTSGPITVRFPTHPKKMDKLAAAYQRRVKQELKNHEDVGRSAKIKS
jgi:hypothetical protein